MTGKKDCGITEELLEHFRKINRETGAHISTQIMMYRKNKYIIKKLK